MTTLLRSLDTAQTLFEQQDGPAIVRQEGGNTLVKGVKLLGYESLNGRRYVHPEAKLYEGKKVNLNHPGMFNGATVESTVGRVQPGSVEVNDRGVWGTLELNPKHAMHETVLWNVENLSNEMGMSHVAATEEVEKSEAGDGIPTYRVLEVISVDIVGRPATTKGFFESVATSPEAKESTVDLTEALAKIADQAKLNAEQALKIVSLTADVSTAKEATLAEKKAHDETKDSHALEARTALLAKYEEDKDLKDIVLGAPSLVRAEELVVKYGKPLVTKATGPQSRLQTESNTDGANTVKKFEELDLTY